MTQQTTEPTAQDQEVAAALGVGINGQEPEGQEQDQQDRAQVAEEVPLEDLPEAWQEEVRRLRRENAQKRVARRDSGRQEQRVEGSEDKAPSAQAIRAAEERGRRDARDEFAQQLAGAEVRAALAAVGLGDTQIEDVVDDLNLTRFVSDGEVDRDAVKHLRDKYVSILGKKTPARPGHGQRAGAPTQKSNADLFGEWLNSGA